MNLKFSIPLFVLCLISVVLALSTHSYWMAGLNIAGVISSGYDIYRSIKRPFPFDPTDWSSRTETPHVISYTYVKENGDNLKDMRLAYYKGLRDGQPNEDLRTTVADAHLTDELKDLLKQVDFSALKEADKINKSALPGLS